LYNSSKYNPQEIDPPLGTELYVMNKINAKYEKKDIKTANLKIFHPREKNSATPSLTI
jgi:hypothetical protein